MIGVTGATGFQGRSLVPALMAAGRQVRAIVPPSRNTALLKPPGVELAMEDVADRDSVRSAWNRLFFEDPLRGLWIQIHSGRRLPFPAFVPDAAPACLAAFTRGRPGQTNNVGGNLISRGANGFISRLAGITSFRLNMAPGLFLPSAAMDRRARREPYYPLNLTPCAFHDYAVSSAKVRAELDFVPTLVKQGACQTIKLYREVGFLKNRR